MMSRKLKMTAAWAALGLILMLIPASAQQRPARPPEYAEFMEAIQIEDLNARIAEIERIKTAYPESVMAAAFDNAILNARIGLSTDVESVLELQKTRLETDDVFGRIVYLYVSAMDIVRHRNLPLFDKAAVTGAVADYAETLQVLSRDPEVLKSFKDDQIRYAGIYAANIRLPQALAHLNEGHPDKAAATLQMYAEAGGQKDKNFFHISGRVFEGLGKTREAYEAYLEAAVESYEDSAEKARDLHEKLFGDAGDFAKILETRQREIPYEAEHFRPDKEWTGKTVLAELFTGSECPPCVGADLGFDGILEAFEPKYVAVLQYHLPIPGPDPMQNHATDMRAGFYGVNSTPTTFFDGQRKHGGGGGRAQAEGKYAQYAGEIRSLLAETPPVKLTASAKLDGDVIAVSFSADRAVAGADIHVALVENEVVHKGGNGLLFHKMVVREFKTFQESDGLKGREEIDLKASEAAAEKHLADFEAERKFTFPVKKTAIDRDALKVVVFVQDGTTKDVHNAVVVDVTR